MNKSFGWIVGIGLALGAALAFWHHRDQSASPAELVAAEPPAPPVAEPAAPTAPAADPAPAPEPPRRLPAPPVRAAAEPTEASLMAELRGISAADPARSLALAREGNAHFPNGPDAAERSWTICKSLAALGRFGEAQDEARRMVSAYPNTSFAADVQRHLLTQPLDDPSQRGQGKLD